MKGATEYVELEKLFEHACEKSPVSALTFEGLFFQLVDKAKKFCPRKPLVEYLHKYASREKIDCGHATYYDIEFCGIRILSCDIVQKYLHA